MDEDNWLSGLIVWGLIIWGGFSLWGWIFPPESSYSGSDYESTYSDPSFHTNDDYQYEYRTGYSGSYEYNYDVSGESDYGDYVEGNIDTEGKYGEGYIYDESGNEVYVETEWVGYGEIEATDEDGNVYYLEAE